MSHRHHTLVAIGVGCLVAGLFSVTALAVDGTGGTGGAFARGSITIYGRSQACLAIGLVIAGGLLLLLRGRARVVAATVGLAGLCAAQLAGVALVGYRRWPLYSGCCSPNGVAELALVRSLALVMALACAVIAVACVVALASEGLLRWRGLTSIVAVSAAVFIAVADALLLAGGWSDGREVAAFALMYSLPFALALAISGLMEPSPAHAVLVGVGVSALLSTLFESVVNLDSDTSAALVLVLVTTGSVAAGRALVKRPALYRARRKAP